MMKSLAIVVCLLATVVVCGSTPAWALSGEQEAKLLPADGEADDNFGYSIAVDGDTAFIGARWDDDNGHNAGSVYVFTRMGGVWTALAKLLPADGGDFKQFGQSVALEGDTALIGAFGDDTNGHLAGAVYVFTYAAGAWTEHAKLLASDGATDDLFGNAVALDGDTALIGAYGADDHGFKSGAAYAFTRTGGVWTEQAKLLPADGANHNEFAEHVALDGDTAIIGARGHDGNGDNAGSAYVFTRAGTVWTEQTRISPADAADGDNFGWGVSLDGDTAIIGASGDSDNGSFSGSAYVFTGSGSVWVEQAKLLPADGAFEDQFSTALALDGDTAVITALRDDVNGSNSGSAYVFTRAAGVWTEQDKLLPTDGAVEDLFGFGVALDGDTAVIGAIHDDDNGTDSGSAYVFHLYDDDVPATNVVGLTLLLLAMLGTGAYFVRRRMST